MENKSTWATYKEIEVTLSDTSKYTIRYAEATPCVLLYGVTCGQFFLFVCFGHVANFLVKIRF